MSSMSWLSPLHWSWLLPRRWSRRRPHAAARSLPRVTSASCHTGDLHPVVDLEGIGPVYEQKLARAGIVNTDQLMAHDTAAISNAIDVPERTVATWQYMAELALVDGIGPQYAEALARAGIQGIDGLRDASPKAIAARVNGYVDGLDVRIIGKRLTAGRIRTWQKHAAGMQRTTVTVRLGGTPLPAKQALKDAGATEEPAAPAMGADDGVQTGRARATVTMGRRHVTRDGWKLYQRNGRYSFQDLTQAQAREQGFTPVYEVPEGYDIQDGSRKPVVRKAA